MNIILSFLWFVFGVAGFIYWWTTEHDLNGYIIFSILIGIFLGPFTWIIGYFIHGRKQ